ncbi:nicotinate-nucleotide pyrophosphorylase [carboxylating] [Cohaesibacter sp. ES.047]|uniref:carboxylating nicotinate-nucleotide diphosphorylase n=1 Tax=Cohaesibacter sp. ES.047 TaxID=1798205 RepID=UPI000BB7D854|nr:carboxylating nicotinate-nucleotide diphosphorylase [Cohaesibacter sp. ES.047]SNY92560.1 nicotinate-nucleotide pyrophosphorylase [carboxylating] [Cohaesibacter sp. ES.047]
MSEATTFSANKLYLPQPIIDEAVLAALKEDLGLAGDITTLSTIPETAHAKAVIAARDEGVISGIPLADSAFRQIGKWHGEIVTFLPQMEDGTEVRKGDVVARIFGPARLVLSAERIALNFMGRMSGIATATHQMVVLTEGTKAKVTCTRKTTPGLRAFEKYAVKCGGGSNHRFGLDDAILIKDNHIAVAGSVTEAIRRAREYIGHLVKIEVEVDTIEQLKEAISNKPDVIMLDNMGPDKLREALSLMDGTDIVSEASGGVSPETIRAVAQTGVDYISAGYITHSAPNFDLGLDISVS